MSEAFAVLNWDIGVGAALQCWFEEDFVVDPVVLAAASAWSDLGVPLALASNQEPLRGRYLEQRLAPLLPIDGTAFSGDLGVVKTDRDFYSRTERHLGLERGARVVFLDDTPANVQAAGAYGWTGIHFTKDRDWQHCASAALDSYRSG